VVNDSGTTKKITIEDLFAGDNVKAKFGTGADLEIYHDGTHSRIKDVGTGHLVLSASEMHFNNAASTENMIKAVEDGAVTAYYNGAAKIATTATGVDVTGNVALPDNGKAIFGNSDDLQIYHDGSNTRIYEAGTGNLKLISDGAKIQLQTSTEAMLDAHPNGSIDLYYDAALKLATTATGVAITGNTSSSSFTTLRIGGGASIIASTGENAYFMSNTYRNSSGTESYILSEQASTLDMYNGTHRFRVAPSGTADSAISWTTAMTIDNNGHVLFGCTSVPTGSVHGAGFVADNDGELRLSASGTGNTTRLRFLNPNNEVGSIRTSGSATAFNTSSDYRLKTDVQPMTGAADRVKLLKPCNFEWIVDGTRVDGFLAHEAEEVVPEAVSGTKDAMMDEEYEVTPATDTEAAVMGTRSVPDMQGIDQSKLVPLLTATIQELIARIEALEA
jgi:hypothetical protein